MTQDRRTPGSNIVNVFSSFDIPKPGTFGLGHEKRFAANVAKSPDRRVHSPRNKSFGLSEKGGTSHVAKTTSIANGVQSRLRREQPARIPAAQGARRRLSGLTSESRMA